MEISNSLLNEPDLYELIIKHLVRSKDVQNKAIELGMQSDDVMTQPIGNAIYKQIADICLSLKYAPIEPSVLCLHLKDRMQNGFLLEQQLNDVAMFVNWIYSDSLCEEYIQSILGQFIKVRRIDKVKLSSGDDSLKLQKELLKLAIDFPELESNTPKSKLENPFDKAVVKKSFSGIQLGFGALDAAIGGIGLGEYVLLLGYSGCGKCHRKDTPIMMHDGSIKPVQDISVGDKVMGPDSKSRIVLSVCTGREKMYDVIPTKGDTWGCNEAHILSLKYNGPSIKPFNRNGRYDISVKDYLDVIAKKPYMKDFLKLHRADTISFTENSYPEAYIVGVWLGDGSRSAPCITSMDQEVVEYLYEYALENSLKIRKFGKKGNKASGYHFRKNKRGGKSALWKLFLDCMDEDKQYKFIPEKYLHASVESRLQLLAGIVDTDGYAYSGCVEVVSKWKGLTENICYLARSLGFAAYFNEKKVKIKEGDIRTYYRIVLSGNLSKIPTKIIRKQIKPRKQVKNVLHVGFELKYTGEDEYFGFNLSDDGLYLLGDFTVTHNSLLGTNIVRNVGMAGRKVLFFSAEEEAPDIFQRIYAQQFRINYSELHQGRIPEAKLQELIDRIEPEVLASLRNNIKIVDIKAEAPINTTRLKAKLEQFASEGFIPELVIFDQMEFIEICDKSNKEAAWKQEDIKSDECDAFSHYLIQGKHKFAFMLLHQVNGNPKRTFNRTDIAGFKGIINPAETVMGIGRESLTSDEFCIFTLKCRHAKNFELDFHGETEYMTFTEMESHRKQSAETRSQTKQPWKTPK